jgi:hypothetical protein
VLRRSGFVTVAGYGSSMKGNNSTERRAGMGFKKKRQVALIVDRRDRGKLVPVHVACQPP